MTLTRPRSVATLFVVICSVALAAVLSGCSSKPEYTAHNIKGVMPDLAFELTNGTGQTVTPGDYQGALTLIYFGYTNCPDICPATMARIRAALGGLSTEQREKINVLFISVDPKRDTPEKISRFAASFGPEFIGLTGSQDQLRALTKRYRVTYGYGKPNDNGYYLVTHSSAIFIFDAQDRARLLANQNEGVDELTQDLKTLLAHPDDPSA